MHSLRAELAHELGKSTATRGKLGADGIFLFQTHRDHRQASTMLECIRIRTTAKVW